MSVVKCQHCSHIQEFSRSPDKVMCDGCLTWITLPEQTECPAESDKEPCSTCDGTGLTGSGQVWDDGFSECNDCCDGWADKAKPKHPQWNGQDIKAPSDLETLRARVGELESGIPAIQSAQARIQELEGQIEAAVEVLKSDNPDYLRIGNALAILNETNEGEKVN